MMNSFLEAPTKLEQMTRSRYHYLMLFSHFHMDLLMAFFQHLLTHRSLGSSSPDLQKPRRK